MKPEQIDVIQTLAIIFNGAVLAYIVWRLERAFDAAAGKLGGVISHQADIHAAIERAFKRIDEIEARAAQAAEGRVEEALKRIADRLEALEKRLPPENQTSIRLLQK